jgi:hypothetical protein
MARVHNGKKKERDMAGPGAGDFLHCGRRGQQAQEKQALLIL